MELVRRLSHHPDLFTCWKNSEAQYGVKFTIANIESFRGPDGIERPGKDHPGLVLADWLAHSVYAAKNTHDRLDGGAGRSEEYRRALIAPFFELYNRKRITLVPLENLAPLSKTSAQVDPGPALKHRVAVR
jgi:hypothetical protein